MQNLAAVLLVFALTPLALSQQQQQIIPAPKPASDNAFSLGTGLLPEHNHYTFPFDGNFSKFHNTPQFVTNLYAGDDDHLPWLNHAPQGVSHAFPWMVSRLGDAYLTPHVDEPAMTRINPRWRWRDVWRPLNLYRVLQNLRATQYNGDGFALREFFQSLPNGGRYGDLARMLFPAQIRHLLVENERVIVASQQNWVGTPTNATRPNQYAPFPRVKVTHASARIGASFAQTGAVGPMSLEASFILATQLAGINWKTLTSALMRRTGAFWTGAIIPQNGSSETIMENRTYSHGLRRMGWVSKIANVSANSGHPDVGFYLVLDIDPRIDGRYDPNKNVFVFAAHLIDPHSRVRVKRTDRLRTISYDPPYVSGRIKPPQIGFPYNGENVRFYAHAHSAVMPYTDWMNWVSQEPQDEHPEGEPMPAYSQIGDMHLYFLLEDEDAVWPRRQYIQ
ncbi:hypothetical protein BC835DRAFT_187804 [Cytidiella melzeri]|nr:hypothetical protein BC835DRAFT_187804 [Cytidiella melzeri]